MEQLNTQYKYKGTPESKGMRINHGLSPYGAFIFLLFLMPNIEAGDADYRNMSGMDMIGRQNPEAIDPVYTIGTAIVDAKKHLADYFRSDAYRKKLETEIKIEKYTGTDLTLENFQEKVENIELTSEDHTRITQLIADRLQRLETLEVIPVYQIAFYENGNFMEDSEGSMIGFYYHKLMGDKHYMGVKINKTDTRFRLPEFGKVYVADLFSYNSSFGTPAEKRNYIMAAIAHEVGGHGVDGFDQFITPGATRGYKLATVKRKGTDMEDYFGDVSEFKSRMLGYRELLFCLGKITSIDATIEASHINFLINYLQKKGDDMGVRLLKKYTPEQLTNVMNGLTIVDEESVYRNAA